MKISKQIQKTSLWLLALGPLLYGLGGAFLPWVWHKSVALQLTAPGLAEFVKFLPELRTGQMTIARLHFLLPLFLAIVSLPVIAVNKSLGWPGWLRWGLRLIIIPLSLAALSPVWTPTILISAEFRLQTILAFVAIGLALTAPVFSRLPLVFLAGVFMITGSIALILASRQFYLVQASITAVYHESISLGWGWWVTVAGLILSIAGSMLRLWLNSK